MKQFMLNAGGLIHTIVESNSHIETDISRAMPAHSHDFYEVFIVLSGSCIHKVNGGEQQLEQGDMVFIRPDDFHSYAYPDDKKTTCGFLNTNFIKKTAAEAFAYLDNRELLQGLLHSALPPVVRLEEQEVAVLMKKSSYINIYDPVNLSKARLAARGVLVDMLTYFYLSHTFSKDDLIPAWFNDLLLALQRDNNFIYGLDRLTELTDKSSGHINRTFKKYLNVTPTEYLNRLKLNYAKLLLITTDLPIITAAFEAGFDNLSHFYHLFKIEYGVSPGQVRQKR